MSTHPTAAAAERLALELRFHILQPQRWLTANSGDRQPFAARSTWASLPASVRRLAAWIARMRMQAARRRALMALDDRTLADIGIDRSEIDSVLAENANRAEATRRRIAAPV
ncbi:MAG TPA: DUF1127 domain-containing protein [Albitalea sp.]|uniref:DUF1127 domain-containing protein n=1 Tax=Piscinibacter sp. TaxID=1903157 RepID=UPI002ED549E1